jgi:hypothetical protein
VSDTSSTGVDQPQLDPATLERIEGQLAVLLPEVRKLRRARWLARGTAIAVVGVVVLGIIGTVVYVQDRNDDEDQRTERRAGLERALVAECEASADQTADLRTAFNVLLGVAVDPTDPEQVALGRQLNDRLDEAVPPRDCVQEARDRARDG